MTSGGKPQLLTQYFKDHALKSPEEYGEEKLVSFSDLDGSLDLDTINDVALLTHAGYLTIKTRVSRNSLLVGYPNKEVSESMAVLYANFLLKKASLDEAGGIAFTRGLMTGDCACVIREINRLFLAINYERYPILSEAGVQACLQVFATGAGFHPIVEKHNARGRSDLEFDAGDFHWVFELKFLTEPTSESEAKRLLTVATSQIVNRHYGEDSPKKTIRLAAVFSASERQFTHWKRVDTSSMR